VQWELVATYEGQRVTLFESADQTKFDQVSRGLLRALEQRAEDRSHAFTIPTGSEISEPAIPHVGDELFPSGTLETEERLAEVLGVAHQDPITVFRDLYTCFGGTTRAATPRLRVAK